MSPRYTPPRRSALATAEQSALTAFLLWAVLAAAVALVVFGYHALRWGWRTLRRALHRKRLQRGLATRRDTMAWFLRTYTLDLIIWGLWVFAGIDRSLTIVGILAAATGMLIATILRFRSAHRPSLWGSGFFVMWLLGAGLHLWPLVVLAGLVTWRFWPTSSKTSASVTPGRPEDRVVGH